VASIAPFAVSIGIVVAAIAGAALMWFKLKTDIAKSQAEIARYQNAEITQQDVKRAAKGLPNGLETVARNNAQKAVDDAKAEIDKQKAIIAEWEQEAPTLIARRDELRKRIADGTTKGIPVNPKAQVIQLSSRLLEYDQAKAELARQQNRLKVNQGTIAKLDKTDTKRTEIAAAKQNAFDVAQAKKEAAAEAARAAREAAAQQAKDAAEAARKARESQFKSLVADVLAQRTKLKQLTAANKSQLQAANLSELGQKYDKIDVKSGSAGKLASEYLRLADAIKKAEGAAAEKSRVTSALAGLYDTVRQKVLLLRDATVENQVAVEVFKKILWQLDPSGKGSNQGHRRAPARGEAALHDRGADQADCRRVEVQDGRSHGRPPRCGRRTRKVPPACRRRRRFHEPRDPGAGAVQTSARTLPPLTRMIVVALAGLNKQLFDMQAADQHKKKIRELANEYQALLYTGSEWGKFLLQREGTDFEGGIDPEKLRRLREEFIALGNVAQARGLEGLRDRLMEMKIAVGEVKFGTTEARIAWEQFHTSLEKMSPEVAAEVRKLAGEFDRLNEKAKKLEAIKQVGATIKDVFRDAFATVLTTGKGFFAALIDGFRQAIIRILAEKAAAAVAKGAEDLLGDILGTKKKDGETGDGASGDAKSTYGAMSRALDDAKRTPTPVTVTNSADLGAANAGNLAPLLSQFMPGAGGMQIPGIPGMGGGGGFAGSIASWGVGQAFGAAAGAATAGIFPVADMLTGGALTKGLGGLVKGVGKIFGFAEGGRPPLGRPSIIGERGPELWVPDGPGRIYSNRDSQNILGGDGGAVNFNGPITFNDAADVRRIQSLTRARRQSRLRLA
jgi:hypothetical protein